MRHSRGRWPEGWTTIAREKGYTKPFGKVGSNRTVMLLNSVQQSTRDGLESDTQLLIILIRIKKTLDLQ
jgi:hypothetical protein